jgi:hypothetical protein
MAEVAIPRILFADILRLVGAAAATGGRIDVKRSSKTKGEVRLDDNEIRISGARRAKCRWLGCTRHYVEGLALPRSVESGNLSVNRAVIQWMSCRNGILMLFS